MSLGLAVTRKKIGQGKRTKQKTSKEQVGAAAKGPTKRCHVDQYIQGSHLLQTLPLQQGDSSIV